MDKPVLMIALVVILFVLLFGLIGNMDFESEIEDHKHHCKMVEIFKETNGAYGWPDDGRCENKKESK